MSTSEQSLPTGGEKGASSASAETPTAQGLRRNVLSLPAVIFLCIAAIAPAASMLFNVPVMASQAGASTPFVFVLSTVGVLLLGVSVAYFSRRLSSAAGFSTWVRHGLGKGAAFQAGWLMLGAYALFEAALQATVGGSLSPHARENPQAASNLPSATSLTCGGGASGRTRNSANGPTKTLC